MRALLRNLVLIFMASLSSSSQRFFDGSSEFEIVFLLDGRTAIGNDENINYNFVALGRIIDLNLKLNGNLQPDHMKAIIRGDEYNRTTLTTDLRRRNCHYLHYDKFKTAAVSICEPNSLRGTIFLNDTMLEIHPLPEELFHLTKRDGQEGHAHIVRRAHLNINPYVDYLHIPLQNRFLEAASHKPNYGLNLEVALFFDEAGYKIFAPHFNYDHGKLQDMLLAYLNGVQALYHQPNLEETIDIVLVRLEIMQKQPAELPHYNGERLKLLDSFCAYQSNLNPKDDDDADHWDMALYISGLDFFAYDNGRKNGATMGLATVGGVCLEKYNCIIAELGTTNIYGKPYPSAGFTSVYILAHEIGHNLGMHHDGIGNECPKDGYIMSPSRGTFGETQWSTCSVEVMKNLKATKCLGDYPNSPAKSEHDHGKFSDTPGHYFTAKKQCEILLKDKDATMLSNQKLNTICYNLQCVTPNRGGFYNSGPALEGTYCGDDKSCYGGECVSRGTIFVSTQPQGQWTPWKSDPCASACINQSVGFKKRYRTCKFAQNCEGTAYDVELCSDEKICGLYDRIAPEEYASEKCKDFAKILPQLDSNGLGLQAPHERDRLWVGCSIFCKRSDSEMFYTPRVELNDLGKSPFFPDGTWCHKEKDVNFYCLQHHCLPEHFQFTKTENADKLETKFPIPQNAHPMVDLPPDLISYLSLGSDGKPLKTHLNYDELWHSVDEEWENKDYVELPENLRRQRPTTL